MDVNEVQKKIGPLSKRYGVRRASVFGSVARGEAHTESDVDIVIEIGTPMGLITYSRLARELEDVLGRPVDLLTPASINRHVRPHIERELTVVYEG